MTAIRPLTGIRILAFESFGAAPFASMMLGDLGAEIIKIENPGSGGDASRRVGPHYLGEPGDSQYFQSFNRSKKTLALDIRHPAGRDVLHTLVAECDVVFDNLRGDLPASLGLDYESLKDVNPAIVCVHISAYGRDNERRNRPGYDYLAQAETGAMSVTGESDGPPARMGLPVVDFGTGLTAVVGMLSAVIAAKESGKGCDVDTCLFDVALHQLAYLGTWYLNGGTVPERLPRSAHPTTAPTQLFKTADGWIMVMCMKEKFWQQLLEVLQRPDLGADDRFHSNEARRSNLQALTEVLDSEFRKAGTAAWVEKLADSVPAAPVYRIDQALESDFVLKNGMIEAIPHPDCPDFRMLGNPLKFAGQRPTGNLCGRLGADSASVLRGFGFTPEQIESLESIGALGAYTE